ncbi:hypothetical protein JHK85_053864 [Glycine max]|nr:hypothetical protein JHK85_053864 [Glycine max]
MSPPLQTRAKLARDALNSDGYCVIGGYLSPVNDAYKKKGLISAEHRIQLCHLAGKSSDLIMVDPWEASQSTYQRTLTVLSRVHNSVCETGLNPSRSCFFVVLISFILLAFLDSGFLTSCDSEQPPTKIEPPLHPSRTPPHPAAAATPAVRTRTQPRACDTPYTKMKVDIATSPGNTRTAATSSGDAPARRRRRRGRYKAWVEYGLGVKTICKDYGVVCIPREGQDVEKTIFKDDILNENKDNIKVVNELVPNQISSTRVRDCIARGLSIKYLTADEVIDYIREQQLYLN